MKKIIAFGVIVLVFILSLVAILSGAIPSFEEEHVDISSWTKAICADNNFCIDVVIHCENGQVVSLEPIPYGVSFGPSWRDGRSTEMKGQFC